MDVDAISPRREQRRPGAADQSCANAGHRFRYRLRRGTLRIVDLVRHRMSFIFHNLSIDKSCNRYFISLGVAPWVRASPKRGNEAHGDRRADMVRPSARAAAPVHDSDEGEIPIGRTMRKRRWGKL